jgi:hypothetical protein
MASRVSILLAILLAASGAATANETLHAEFPLNPTRDVTQTQRNCSHDNVIAICSDFSLGLWKERFSDCADDSDGCVIWIGLGIMSPFDGGYTITVSGSKALALVPQDGADIVKLSGNSEPGLYALQIGYNPGSRYLLLSAEPGKTPISHAAVLDVRCPDGWAGVRMRRNPHPPGVYHTDYCDVSSYAALKRLAEDALNRAPFATLEWVDQADRPGLAR